MLKAAAAKVYQTGLALMLGAAFALASPAALARKAPEAGVSVSGFETVSLADLPREGRTTYARILQGQRKARADQSAPDDRQALHQAACSRAAAISASISATLFGTPPVRISQPFLVTTTSSSMRTPMPRHFLATFWLSAAI